MVIATGKRDRNFAVLVRRNAISTSYIIFIIRRVQQCDFLVSTLGSIFRC